MEPYRIWPLQSGGRRAWQPWRELEEVRQAIEQISARAEASLHRVESRDFVPHADLYETGSAFVALVDLPGVGPEDIVVTIDGGVLTVEGQRTTARPDGAALRCCERRSGRFTRALPVPAGIEIAGAKAVLRAGVLEIILPKGQTPAALKAVVKIVRDAHLSAELAAAESRQSAV